MEVSLPRCTTMLAVPWPAGMGKMSCPSRTETGVVATPSTQATPVLPKLVPLSVTRKPPAVLPPVGESAAMAGAS